jgi:hypothetical protein
MPCLLGDSVPLGISFKNKGKKKGAAAEDKIKEPQQNARCDDELKQLDLKKHKLGVRIATESA